MTENEKKEERLVTVQLTEAAYENYIHIVSFVSLMYKDVQLYKIKDAVVSSAIRTLYENIIREMTGMKK